MVNEERTESVKTRWFTRLLMVTLLLETGVVLMVVPWSSYWERNLFFDMLPFLRAPMQSHIVRGGISGLGVVDVCVGLFDLSALILGRAFGHGARSRLASPDQRALSEGRVVRGPTSDAG